MKVAVVLGTKVLNPIRGVGVQGVPIVSRCPDQAHAEASPLEAEGIV